MKLITLLFLSLLYSFSLLAQDEQSALAYEYYSKGEYEKAVELYKELAKDPQRLTKIHRFYLESMMRSEQEKEAEKYLKKLVRKYPDVPMFNIDYGVMLIEPMDSTKGYEYFNDFIYFHMTGHP